MFTARGSEPNLPSRDRQGDGLPVFFSSPRGAAIIPLGEALLPGSSNLPGSRTERAAPPPLFGLAPHGVCPAKRIAPSAVRPYRTFSPLPKIELAPHSRRYIFCGTFREIRFERTPPAVSRHAALWRPDFPPANWKTGSRATTRTTGPTSLSQKRRWTAREENWRRIGKRRQLAKGFVQARLFSAPRGAWGLVRAGGVFRAKPELAS